MQTNKQIIVIKCGGSILHIQIELENIIKNIAALKRLAYQIILVHGGGPEINQLCSKFKLESNFKQGLRITTSEVLECTQLALLGKTNPELVSKLNQANINALGLSGHAANLLHASYVNQAQLGYVGKINRVNTNLLRQLILLDITPVIAPLALDDKYQVLNVNADSAAAAIAIAIQADKLIFLSDIDGYYSNYPDENSLVKHLDSEELQQLLNNPDAKISSGMIPKLEACLSAVNGNVASAQIINAKCPHGLQDAIMQRSQIGTTVRFHHHENLDSVKLEHNSKSNFAELMPC